MVVKDSLDSSELFKTRTFKAVDKAVQQVEDIIIPRNWAEGWYVTLGGSHESRLTDQNTVEVLIDNQKFLESLVQSINRAKPSIKGQILPYSTESSAKTQLEDMKINTEDWEVLE